MSVELTSSTFSTSDLYFRILLLSHGPQRKPANKMININVFHVLYAHIFYTSVKG